MVNVTVTGRKRRIKYTNVSESVNKKQENNTHRERCDVTF